MNKNKKKNNAAESVANATVETVQTIDNSVSTPSTTTSAIVVTLPKGRPVVEGSARQIKLKAMQERIAANGGVAIGRGRPVNPDSDRQKSLLTKGVGNGKQGRPTNPDSVRQIQLAARTVKLAELQAKAEAAAAIAPTV